MNDIIFYPESQKLGHQYPLPPWKVLIVDDVAEVHAVTALAFKEFTFSGRPIQLLSAFTGEECLQILQKNSDIGVIILDVVMESHRAGLEVVGYIRKILGNNLIRIIIRTGQPGDFPEQELIATYDINDYREKTELTVGRLQTSLTSALRAYRDLLTLNRSTSLLRSITQTSTELIASTDLKTLVSHTLEGFGKLLKELEIEMSTYSALLVAPSESVWPILGGTGRFDTGKQADTSDFINLEDHQILEGVYNSRQGFFRESLCCQIFRTRMGTEYLFLAQWQGPVGTYETDLFQIFLQKAASAFENLELIQSLENRQQELSQNLLEKELLIKEIHHRVKNNLQIISSLLSVESENIPESLNLNSFRDTKNRILSMALVHEKLYQSNNLALIDLCAYVEGLCQDLAYSFHFQNRLTLQVATDPLWVGIDDAIPCGLLINELITNAIKYAFPSGQAGFVNVSLTHTDKVLLTVSDNGVGMIKDLSDKETPHLGLRLIRILTDQLKGELTTDSETGTKVSIAFSPKMLAPHFK